MVAAQYDTLPDPAFILPWRYDPEGGPAIEGFTDIQRLRTKDITISNGAARPATDCNCRRRCTTTASKSTASANQAKSGDGALLPGATRRGGELITGADGLQPGASAARETVRASWTVPTDVTDWRYARIYAVIDPDNAIAEIHDENNKGWTVLDFVCAACTSTPDLSIVPGSIQIFRQTGTFYRVKAQIGWRAPAGGVPVEFLRRQPGPARRKLRRRDRCDRRLRAVSHRPGGEPGGRRQCSAGVCRTRSGFDRGRGREDSASSNNTAGAWSAMHGGRGARYICR